MRTLLLGVLFCLLTLGGGAVAGAAGDGRMMTRYWQISQAEWRGYGRLLSSKAFTEEAPVSSAQVQKLFTERGVVFPSGSSVIYSPEMQLLVVHHTAKYQEHIEGIFLGCGDRLRYQLRCEARLVEVPTALAGKLEGRSTFAELERKFRGKVRTVSWAGVLTRSGNRVQLALGRQVGRNSPDDASSAGADFVETCKVEFEPIVGPDGQTVDWAYEVDFFAPGKLRGKEPAFQVAGYLRSASGEIRVVRGIGRTEDANGADIVALVLVRVERVDLWSEETP